MSAPLPQRTAAPGASPEPPEPWPALCPLPLPPGAVGGSRLFQCTWGCPLLAAGTGLTVRLQLLLPASVSARKRSSEWRRSQIALCQHPTRGVEPASPGCLQFALGRPTDTEG